MPVTNASHSREENLNIGPDRAFESRTRTTSLSNATSTQLVPPDFELVRHSTGSRSLSFTLPPLHYIASPKQARWHVTALFVTLMTISWQLVSYTSDKCCGARPKGQLSQLIERFPVVDDAIDIISRNERSEEHTSELQSPMYL